MNFVCFPNEVPYVFLERLLCEMSSLGLSGVYKTIDDKTIDYVCINPNCNVYLHV